jgi:exonuclease III
MKLSILSWNVRGLNKRDKRLRVSNLLRDWKVDIVCFQ